MLPDDLKAMAACTLAHRIFLHQGDDAAPLLRQVLADVPVPL